MAWYDGAVFYHIYPLGLSGAPKSNDYKEPVHRLNTLIPWIEHIRSIGCNALYIGPLFESGSHGYDTTDYRKLDSRLGTNEDLKAFVAECHKTGIRVILDGVLNHVGRDFFAFQDLKKNRENSPYRDWFCNVNFWGNNEYNDGFSYDNWGGYNLLVKLNQRNGEVQNYLCDTIRMWVSEFDIDGLRLDAADVLDFGFMQALRRLANEVKPEFWLMGEVIHGDYTRWANASTLHSVTDYNLHKALYSGHNDHNYFEIAHTVKRLYGMGMNHPGGIKLYTFVDNHDVERIYTKLQVKANFIPVHILLYTLPGIPSIYYGSEFGIEGRKERGSDDSLRPALSLSDYKDAETQNPYTRLISTLGRMHQNVPQLIDGDYQELQLTTRQYVFARKLNGRSVIVAVNNDENPVDLRVQTENEETYIGVLSAQKKTAAGRCLSFTISGNSGEIWIPEGVYDPEAEALLKEIPETPRQSSAEEPAQDLPSAPTDGTSPLEAAAQAEQPDPLKASVPAEQPTQDLPPAPVETAAAAKQDAQEGINAAPASETKAARAVDSASLAAMKSTAPQSVHRSYEEMTVEELQAAILEKLAKNGPVTDRMRKEVAENIWHDSLVNWVKSFH